MRLGVANSEPINVELNLYTKHPYLKVCFIPGKFFELGEGWSRLRRGRNGSRGGSSRGGSGFEGCNLSNEGFDNRGELVMAFANGV